MPTGRLPCLIPSRDSAVCGNGVKVGAMVGVTTSLAFDSRDGGQGAGTAAALPARAEQKGTAAQKGRL